MNFEKIMKVVKDLKRDLEGVRAVRTSKGSGHIVSVMAFGPEMFGRVTVLEISYKSRASADELVGRING